MKKLFLLLAIATLTFGFTACEDVPAPYTVSTPGEGGEEEEILPEGDGTLDNPYNCLAANNYAAALADGEESPTVYIKGKVVSVKEQYSTQYGNASFYISDDGTSKDQFYVYRALYLGNVKYTSGTLLQAGDEVVICGRVTNYMGNTPETVQGKAYLVSLKSNGSGEGGNDNPGGGEDVGDPSQSNGDFENWTGGKPNNWTTASTAGNATLSQSTDAHGGQYAVEVAGINSANKRLAYKEMTLPAGTYTMKFYTKAATATGGSVRPGYVPIKDDGSVGSYVYGDYVNDLKQGEWILVTHEFTLEGETKLSLVIMNSKNPGGNVLIDDFTLTDASGKVYIK